ncbi:MAG: tetratricopeptide repeat protein [Sumerlaeia bacterium]
MDHRGQDPLASLLQLMSSAEYAAAKAELAALDRTHLSLEDCGRLLALEAKCRERLGGKGDLQRFLQGLTTFYGKSPRLMHGAGRMLCDLGEYLQAEIVLRRVISIDPESASPYFNLALTLERSERFEDAIEAYVSSARREKAVMHSWCGAARCQLELGQLEDAADSYRRCLESDPGQTSIWVSYAEVLADLGKVDEATMAYRQAEGLDVMEHGVPSANLLYSRACTSLGFRAEGEFEECRRMLVERHPGDWRSAMVEALQCQEEKQPVVGWHHCQEACRRAVASGNAADAEKAILASLRYAQRQNLRDSMTEFTQWLCEAELFSTNILDAMRSVFGTYKDNAIDYFVLVNGSSQQCSPPPGETPPPQVRGNYRYLRGYRVYEESAQLATEEAIRFEGLCGGQNLRFDNVAALADPQPEYTGVWWRAEDPVWYAVQSTDTEPDITSGN